MLVQEVRIDVRGGYPGQPNWIVLVRDPHIVRNSSFADLLIRKVKTQSVVVGFRVFVHVVLHAKADPRVLFARFILWRSDVLLKLRSRVVVS